MSFLFPSEEWVQEFKKQINASDAYKQSGAKWEGPLILLIHANPAIGIPEDYSMWLDLYHGECLDAKPIPSPEGTTAKFVIKAEYERWKQVLKGELDPLKGMIQGKIQVKGDLFTLLKYTKAAKDLIDCTAKIATRFLDE
jgi:putative sterol carrier protein